MGMVKRTSFHDCCYVFCSGSDHLRDVFYTMGLSDQDIVALSGGHTLVRFALSFKCAET